MLRKLNLRNLTFKKVFFSGEISKFSDSFMSGTNATYIENLYNNWLVNPKSVPASWDAYFHNEAKDLPV
jgi:2-oxoglutarate dehydrogenase E1 component